MFRFEGTPQITESGDNSEGVTPVPIPNTEVKPLSADDTWWVTARESRSLPVQYLIGPHGQAVKTPPFHGGNSSSILDGVTKFSTVVGAFFIFSIRILISFNFNTLTVNVKYGTL